MKLMLESAHEIVENDPMFPRHDSPMTHVKNWAQSQAKEYLPRDEYG